MYLKSIDMFGFKSFAKKMTFQFDNGITGIVGPNGSGKSNIADAVRWVLGEQSAKLLRGSKMQDVIFAGTENRKPLGYCQVDITIDNGDLKMPIDYTEVTVSRRVYRSGESNFYINGSACRLKDIHELFMDTGVGKEGYSIIGQGQIDKILSTKPDDRRALFDEAAGIVKFKKRKMTAEKKLEEEKQSLLRVNDIIRELEERQSLLEGQAEIAKQFLTYKEELKKYEINIFLLEAEKLIKDIEAISEKERIVNEQVENANKEIDTIKSRHQELLTFIEKLEEEIDAIKKEATKSTIEKEKTENNIELIKLEIANLEKTNKRIDSQNQELNEKLEKNTAWKNDYQTSLEQLTEDYKAKEEILNNTQGEFDTVMTQIGEEEKSIETIKSDIIERLNEISNVKSKVLRYETIAESNRSRKTVVEARVAILGQTLVNLKNEAKSIEHQGQQLLEEKNALDNSKQQFAKNMQRSQEEKNKLEEILKAKMSSLATLESKLRALNDLSEHYEGYNFSIKKIMEYKKRINETGVLGVVADIIRVKEEYEVAIETALGGSVQNIVTDNEDTAKKMIHMLKKNRYGRATFLPLTSIKKRSNYKKVSEDDKGFLGYGHELVEVEEPYKDVAQYLLGNVIVVDHIDHGIQLAKKYNYSLRIVTTAGELINPGGSLTGGAYKNKGNQFLSRKREIDTYHQDISKLTVEVEDGKKVLRQATHDYEEYSKELALLSGKENKLHLAINSCHMQSKQYEGDIEKNEEEYKQFVDELIELQNQESETDKAIMALKASLDGTENLNQEAEANVTALMASIQHKKEDNQSLSDRVTTLKVDLSTVNQQLQNAKENVRRIDREIEEIQISITRNNHEISDNKKQMEQNEERIEAFIIRIKEQDVEVANIEVKVKELTEKKQVMALEQEELYKKREEQSDHIHLLDKELVRLQNNKYKLETQRDSSRDYIWNEYEVTYNSGQDYKDESLPNLSEMKRFISKLKTNIKQLGSVNVNAIEEYKAVSERYQFLTTQRDDLLEAEKRLIEVIKELTLQMEKQFKEKFREITIKFDEVFKELFGGGKGILRLTEMDDVLESGIEIIAQPPGKKLQSMMLLSGGEKALSAIALLFAIQSLKPSPFCVLDEIEAALDDANVVRFANYLKKLTHNTQFIVITHRRGTMEAADSLYGITMQEKGVSTQVSVKILHDDLD